MKKVRRHNNSDQMATSSFVVYLSLPAHLWAGDLVIVNGRKHH
jgi:hypothetical protein